MSEVETKLILDGRDLIVSSTQDVEGILEHNKVLRSMAQKSDWGRHVASIPCNILVAWLNEEWARGNVNLRFNSPEFNAMVKRKLDDPDWRHLRTDGAETGYVNGALGFGG